MKTLLNLFYKFTIKDWDTKFQSAKLTANMIKESTNGGVKLLYNAQGQKIRGVYKAPTKFKEAIHPLIQKYN